MRKLFGVMVVFLLLPSVSSAQTDVTNLVTCQPAAHWSVTGAVMSVSQRLGINPVYLWSLLKVETSLGGYLGEPGGALSDAKFEVDMSFYLSIMYVHGLNPARACASVSGGGRGSYGGALGPAQMLSSTWAKYAGLVIVSSPPFQFSRGVVRLGGSHQDVLTLQRVLNRAGYTVSSLEAGSPGRETSYFGQKTQAALRQFQSDRMGSWADSSVCAGELQSGSFGGCSKAALLLLFGRPVVHYDPSEDEITRLLGDPIPRHVSDVPNPWNVEHAVAAAALLLRDLGIRSNPERAFRSYFAGGNWRGDRASRYWQRIQEAIQLFPYRR